MLTMERASQLLKPDFETGKLVWIQNYQRSDLKGRRAGHINNGYWRLSIDGTEYYVCQIIWLLYYGYLPVKTIDHEDGVGTNDAISNLRLASKGQNAANSKMNSRNTSGFKGVSFCKATGRWRASIRINGTEKNLGRYDMPEEAHKAWVCAAVAAYGAEFVRTA